VPRSVCEVLIDAVVGERLRRYRVFAQPSRSALMWLATFCLRHLAHDLTEPTLSALLDPLLAGTQAGHARRGDFATR
jgi:hypothetical protein